MLLAWPSKWVWWSQPNRGAYGEQPSTSILNISSTEFHWGGFGLQSAQRNTGKDQGDMQSLVLWLSAELFGFWYNVKHALALTSDNQYSAYKWKSEKEHLDCCVVDLKIMTMEFGLRATGCLLKWLHTALSHCFSQGLEFCQDLRTLYRWDECCSPFSKFTSQTELLFIHNQGKNRYHLGRIFGNFLTYFPQYI